MPLYLRSPSGYFSFNVQQHFHDETIPASVLSYKLKPIDGKQARFADRVAVYPSIDLSQYRRKAVVDWVEVVVYFRGMTQGRHIHDWIERQLGVLVYARPLPRNKDRKDQSGEEAAGEGKKQDSRTSDVFAIRIQDPRKAQVDQIVAALESRWGYMSEPVVHGLEVSIDWYSRNNSIEELRAMTGMLQRHFVPFGLNPSHRGARPRSVYGTFAGKDGKDHHYTRHLYQPDLDTYSAPIVDGTLYFGTQDTPIYWKVMLKVSDQRTGGSHRELPIEQRRARVEVTLQGEALLSLGVRTLSDLCDFRFERLKRDFFGFSLPTVPGEIDAGGMARPKPVGYRHLSIFQRSGAFQFMHWERGYTDLGIRTAIRNGRRRSDARILKQRRLLKQDHMFMLAYDELNRQAESALRSLRWGR